MYFDLTVEILWMLIGWMIILWIVKYLKIIFFSCSLVWLAIEPDSNWTGHLTGWTSNPVFKTIGFLGEKLISNWINIGQTQHKRKKANECFFIRQMKFEFELELSSFKVIFFDEFKSGNLPDLAENSAASSFKSDNQP